MPELPEVETIRAGLEPWLIGRTICGIEVHTPKLRWPIPTNELKQRLIGQPIRALSRRGKYLLWTTDTGHLLIHLGMSGRVFHVKHIDRPADPHDHVFWILDDATRICLRDPRRFGAVLWVEGDWRNHPLLVDLGPEPLSADFDAAHLLRWSNRRRVALQTLLMNGRVVVGVGNIYAAEALFCAGLHPARPAHTLTGPEACRLVQAIRQVLSQAIEQGGTTLRDYRQSDGSPGYFAVSLQVYGRQKEPCRRCGSPIQRIRLGQRSAFFCPCCQVVSVNPRPL